MLGAGKSIAIDTTIGIVTGGTAKVALKLYQRTNKSLHLNIKLSEKSQNSPHQIVRNNEIGRVAEEVVTAGLRKRFGSAIVAEQVRGKFSDGTYAVFDNVVIEKGVPKLVNETKAGDATLSYNQKRFFENGETITFYGSRAEAVGIDNIKINRDQVETSITRVEYTIE